MTPQQSSASTHDVEATLLAYERFMQRLSIGHAPDFVDTSMTMAQLKVLYLLWVRHEIRMSELASMLGVAISTISEHLDRLVEAGWATRRDDPADRRHAMVAISPAGTDLLDRFRELGLRQFRDLISTLHPDELDLVRRCIELLTAAASRKDRP